ncbi:PfkB family carbohydrate kinase [Elusimicrobiota bacterium]
MGIVVVGSIALDTISTPKIKRNNVLGGSAVYASLALAPFIKPRMLGVVGEDFPKDYINRLHDRGIDTEGVQIMKGKTFAWEGSYGDDLSEACTRSTCLNVFETFDPSVPDSYADEKFLFLGNIDPVLQLRVLKKMKKPKIVATDTIDLWLDTKLDVLKELLHHIDIFFINEKESKKLSGEKKVLTASRKISGWGPRIVVVKSGEHGAQAFHREANRFYMAPAYPGCEVVDPTGAGDSFAGGFLGSLVNEKDPFRDTAIKKALYAGNVLSSYAISTFSVDYLLNLAKEEVESRLKMLTDMTFCKFAPFKIFSVPARN